MSLLDLDVEKIVAGGRGLARVDGMAVFIAGAAPGDRLRVRVTGQRRNHATAEIVEVLHPGPSRAVPKCLKFGECGGCHVQHIEAGQQRVVKKEVVVENLRRIGHFEGVAVADVAEVSPAWQYRRKAGFKVRVVRGQPLLGFHQVGSHRVVDVPHCPVLRPELDGLLHPLRALVDSLTIRGQIPQIDVMAGDVGVGLVMHVLHSLSERDRDHCCSFASENNLARFDVQQGQKNRMVSLYQNGPLDYRLEGMDLKFLPVDFIQVNGEGNVRMVALVMDLAGRGKWAWDLFSGIGNFTLSLARRYEQVLAVEGSRSSLDRLDLNARRAGLAGVMALEADLFSPEGLEKLKQHVVPELILMDPPRGGSVEFCKNIKQFKPKRLIYVSCDPATFSRDAAIIVHGGGQLRSVLPVDLFPQTHHVELIATFEFDY